VRFGMMLPSVGGLSDLATLTRLARAAEDAGLESVWVPHHDAIPGSRKSVYPYQQSKTERAFVPGVQWLDPLVTLGAIAAGTTRIRLGTAVVIITQRNPIVTATEVASLDQISGGRVEFGVGVGWMAEEFAALGANFEDRGAAGDEYIEAMRLLWRSTEPCSFHGKHVSFDDIVTTCRPVSGSVPIWVGGHTNPALRRSAKLGDGWHGFEASIDDVRGYRERIEKYCADAGRDPATLRMAVHRNIEPPFEATNYLPDRPVIRADEAIDTIKTYEELGIDLLVLDLHYAPDEIVKILDWVGADLVPAVG
jgi:probable F420-dependent oxidoreductase